MKQDTLVAIIFVCFLIMSGLTFITILDKEEPIIKDVDCVCKVNVTKPSRTISDLELLELISTRFAEVHEYNKSSYNCVNYSNDYMMVLTKLGYNVSTIKGYNETINGIRHGHMWNKIELEIESQTGKMINYLEEYPMR